MWADGRGHVSSFGGFDPDEPMLTREKDIAWNRGGKSGELNVGCWMYGD